MTKIPVHVWIAGVVFLTVLTIAYQLAPEVIIGFVLFISFILSGCTLIVSLAKYMEKK